MSTNLSGYVFFLLLGFISSGIASSLGLGGGSIVVPVAIAFLRIPHYYLVSAALTMVVGTSLMATYNYFKMGFVNFTLGLALELFTVPGAILGAEVCSKTSHQSFKLILGVLLLITAIRIILSKGKDKDDLDKSNLRTWRGFKRKILLAILLSFTAGFFSGYLGIGGGVLKVPMMIILGVPTKIAVGTSSFMIGITALSGLITYALKGLWNWKIAIPLLIGALVGANIGPRITRALPERYIRYSFGVLLSLIAPKGSPELTIHI